MCAAALLLLAPFAAHAARLYVVKDSASSSPVAGEEIRLRVFLDPEGEEVNALEGEVRFSPPIVLLGVDTSASVVPLWIEDPSLLALSPRAVRKVGAVRFSGIIPGGFGGTRRPLGKIRAAGSVFTLSARAPASGTYRVSFDKVRILRHDGKGTPVAVAADGIFFTARAPASSPAVPSRPPLFYLAVLAVGLLCLLYLLWRVFHSRTLTGKR